MARDGTMQLKIALAPIHVQGEGAQETWEACVLDAFCEPVPIEGFEEILRPIGWSSGAFVVQLLPLSG